jgi:hypothetical protein
LKLVGIILDDLAKLFPGSRLAAALFKLCLLIYSQTVLQANEFHIFFIIAVILVVQVAIRAFIIAFLGLPATFYEAFSVYFRFFDGDSLLSGLVELKTIEETLEFSILLKTQCEAR